jgi:hypothetical protein
VRLLLYRGILAFGVLGLSVAGSSVVSFYINCGNRGGQVVLTAEKKLVCD